MYWGSVKFFKHIFMLIIISLILIPSFLAINQQKTNIELSKELGMMIKEYGELQNRVKELEAVAEFAKTLGENFHDKTQKDYQFELPYQDMYPELYIDEIPPQVKASNTVYLSFDDGPSDLTAKVLDVLKEKEVKATFFVVGENLESAKGAALLERIAGEGHGIGVHCYNHIYSNLYSSVESYLDDFHKVFMKIYDITGEKPEIFRFPGGSINGYSRGIYQELIAELLRRGFVYYDWNVSSRDSDIKTDRDQIIEDVMGGIKKKPRSIVLMHDTDSKKETLKALPAIIDELKENNYELGVITREVAPVIFVYRD